MCGRFAQAIDKLLVQQRYRLKTMQDFEPRYNVAPLTDVFIVRQHGDEREGVAYRWGLVPGWAKEATIASRLINVRAETVAEKPAFKRALQRWRCVVPASGFYEWRPQKIGGKTIKQPFYIHGADDALLNLAGITERWTSPEGHTLHSFAILTTEANPLLEPVHDRMPVILPPEALDAWLDPVQQDADFLQSLLRPYAAARLDLYAVSREVNKAGPEGEQLLRPLPDAFAPG